MGSAAAIFLIGGSPWTQSGWTIRSELTQFDADAAAIAKAVEVKIGRASCRERVCLAV